VQFLSPLPWRRSARPQTVRNAVQRLATARFISLAGSDATGVALGFALYSQTHSPKWISLSLLLTIGAGALLAPLGGRLGDLADRRRLMIATEVSSAAVFLALVLVHTPVALLALGLLATVIGTVFGPASGAAIAHVAGEEHMTWANGLVATGANLGKTAGRLAGGALVAALGAGSVFLLDAMTFLASAMIIRSVRHGFSAPIDGPGAPRPAAPRGGMRVLLGDPTLRLVAAAACISTFATAFSMTAEIPMAFELGAGAIGLGALTAAWGVGMVAGSWYGGRSLHAGNEATGLLAGRLTMALGVALVAAAPHLGAALACYVLGGLGGGLMGVAAQSLILRNTPERSRASVLGAMDACRNAAFGAGVVLAGATVAVAGARPVYAAVGGVMALGALPAAALVMRLGGPRRLRPMALAA
jgi:predicted MFS family arabinose efflux permease